MSYIIGIISSIISSVLKTLLSRPKLEVEVCRHGINNLYFDQKGEEGHSEVEVLLRLSNSGGKPLGISKVLVCSNDRSYNIAASLYEYSDNWKERPMHSLRLEPQETRLVILHDEGNPSVPIEREFVEAEIEIYNTKYKIMKSIPVKLYISSHWLG